MYHKILILVAAVGAVSNFIRYFLFDVEINWWAVLTCGLVIVGNLRELQFDKIKEYYDTAFVSLKCFKEAALSVCDKETINRIALRAADNIVDMAPEELQPELRKINEMLKKMQKIQPRGSQKCHPDTAPTALKDG